MILLYLPSTSESPQTIVVLKTYCLVNIACITVPLSEGLNESKILVQQRLWFPLTLLILAAPGNINSCHNFSLARILQFKLMLPHILVVRNAVPGPVIIKIFSIFLQVSKGD